SLALIHHPWVSTWGDSHSYDGPTTPRAAATRQSERCRCGAMVEGSMAQGAGQGPEVERTATLRDFRVPAYVHETGASTQSIHPGDVVPPAEEAAYPEGYTPTQRDLPVINRGDTVQVTVDPVSVPAPQQAEGPGPLYVVGDVHGYLDELVAALQEKGLLDSSGHWCAGTPRLWLLGHFPVRGPDGIGVIDLVMRLSAEAAAAGGYCKALMGNHELLLLGAKRFGDTPVNSGAGTATFQAAWLLNGGQKTDMDRLQDHHLQWMSRL